MQHPNGASWCVNCGRFDFACEGTDCPTPGSGDFDQETDRGAARIADCLFETFQPEADSPPQIERRS